MERGQCYKEDIVKNMSKSGLSSPFPAGHKEGSSEEVLVKDCKVGNRKRVI